jgi:hypothetical protein
MMNPLLRIIEEYLPILLPSECGGSYFATQWMMGVSFFLPVISLLISWRGSRFEYDDLDIGKFNEEH